MNLTEQEQEQLEALMESVADHFDTMVKATANENFESGKVAFARTLASLHFNVTAELVSVERLCAYLAHAICQEAKQRQQCEQQEVCE